MPIVTIQCITTARDKEYPHATVQTLSDALGELFESESGGTWVKMQYIDRKNYAENDTGMDSGVEPTFVEVLKRSLPAQDALANEAASIAATIGQVLSRRPENVHVVYLPEGSGRVAFGGNLIRK